MLQKISLVFIGALLLFALPGYADARGNKGGNHGNRGYSSHHRGHNSHYGKHNSHYRKHNSYRGGHYGYRGGSYSHHRRYRPYYGYYAPWVAPLVWGSAWANYNSYPRQNTVVVREQPVYVERPTTTAPPDAFWYYCQSAGAYYPDVQTCSEAWVPVPPTPAAR